MGKQSTPQTQQAKPWGPALPFIQRGMGQAEDMFSGELPDQFSGIQDTLSNLMQGQTPTDEGFDASQKSLLDMLQHPEQSPTFQAAQHQIIPGIESRFEQAGGMHGGAARAAETGALSDALAKTQMGAAQQLGGMGLQHMGQELQGQRQQLGAAEGLQNLLNMPRQQFLQYLQALQGFGSMGGTQTMQQAQGSDPMSGLLGLGLLGASIFGGGAGAGLAGLGGGIGAGAAAAL